MQLFWWMLLSGLFISAVAFSFYYTLKVVLTQKRLSEMKSDFINNMTHEFKTPVATISIAGEMLLKDEILSNPDRAKKYASIILSENRRLQEQSEQVLQSALLEKDAVKLRKQQADVHQIVREVLESFQLQIKERNGVLNHFFEAAHANLKVDRFHISNVITNLIDNAIKYSPDTLDVQLHSWSDTKGFYLKVSDKGMGISREDVKHIFKNLYRVHTGDRHDVKGFGIGLFYVKKIIEAHGGYILVESESGKGTSFTLFLPFLSQDIDQMNDHE
jgi:two-component system phosphate regulon sensor histidine kinase PhoR